MTKTLIIATNIIPLMTNPLGKQWYQPTLDEILLNDKYAFMTDNSLKKLKNYSHSTPSGVYEGKMWRSEGWDNGKLTNYLNWWDVSEKADHCSHKIRTIIPMHIQQQKRDTVLHILHSNLLMEGFSMQELGLMTDEDYNSLDITVTLDLVGPPYPSRHIRNWVGPVSSSS